MNIKDQFKVRKILTIDEYGKFTDVIKIVEWECIFTDGVSSATVHGETTFDLSRLDDNFLDVSNVSPETIETWIKEEMGSRWDFMVEEHYQQLQKMTDKESLTVYYIDETTDMSE